jgi:hypothetical protein
MPNDTWDIMKAEKELQAAITMMILNTIVQITLEMLTKTISAH